MTVTDVAKDREPRGMSVTLKMKAASPMAHLLHETFQEGEDVPAWGARWRVTTYRGHLGKNEAEYTLVSVSAITEIMQQNIKSMEGKQVDDHQLAFEPAQVLN